MNSILTVKEISATHNFASHLWYYKFRDVHSLCSERKFGVCVNNMATRYAPLTQQWDPRKNSEWICRIYLSMKMILSATLQLQALDHARKQNLRIVVPYLEYYSILSLLRSIIYTLPECDWNNGQLIAIPHKKAITYAFEHLSRFNAEKSKLFKRATFDLKANRELISYRSPSSGDQLLIQHDDIIQMATIMAELAQINSELLEESINKYATNSSFIFLDEYARHLKSQTIEDRTFFDHEDSYRLGYFKRKYPLPTNILHAMTAGHVEDFFGAWVNNEDDAYGFDPDNNWRLIFDIP